MQQTAHRAADAAAVRHGTLWHVRGNSSWERSRLSSSSSLWVIALPLTILPLMVWPSARTAAFGNDLFQQVASLESAVMKLNHLNLTVTDVCEAHQFLEKYFGLRSMGEPNDNMAGLHDDDGLALVLMKGGQTTEVKYPASFHIGFRQESEEKVNEIYQRL